MTEIARQKAKSCAAWIVAIILALAYLIISFLPLFFMVLNSFKGRFEMLLIGIFALPESFSFANYAQVLSGDFFRYFLNSVIVLAISLVILLFVTSCASYPLARFRFRLSKPIYSLIVACMTIPIHITLIPVFRMSQTTGLYDSIWALIGPYVAFALPISVFIMTAFMKAGIPRELEESAEIDGCGKIRMFFTVIMPLSVPGLSTISIYNGVNMWNEFSFSYTLTQSRSSRTLPLAIWDFQGQYSTDTPVILAVLTLTLIPMIVLFIFLQDKLVKGMTAGAVKG